MTLEGTASEETTPSCYAELQDSIHGAKEISVLPTYIWWVDVEFMVAYMCSHDTRNLGIS